MARPVKPDTSPVIDAHKNEAVARTIIGDYPKEVSGLVGMHALGKLAETVPHEEFVSFIEAALHHALTGEMPPQSDEAGQQQGQPQTQTPQAPDSERA